MTKKTHQKQLDRARAKRQAERTHVKATHRRNYLIIAVVILAVAAVVLPMLLRDEDPGVGIDDPSSQSEPAGEVTPSDVPLTDDPCPAPEGAPDVTSKTYDAAPGMTIDPSATYTATMVTTCGTIVLELDAASAPVTVNNFVTLARDGYYDGIVFHRVINDFMIQGGDPLGVGTGGPGYAFEDELALAEQLVADTGGYPRGTLAMANAGPNTNGSQFFIVQGMGEGHDTPYPLPANYSAFGRVTQGFEVIDDIAAGTVNGDAPVVPVKIISITIDGP